MREIKAYVRPERVADVVSALADAGVANLTMNRVRSLGSGVDPKHWGLSVEAGARYSEMAKLELVCSEPDLERLLALIRARALTGTPGDGLVFVSPVDRAVKIRTGATGREALR